MAATDTQVAKRGDFNPFFKLFMISFLKLTKYQLNSFKRVKHFK